MKTSILLARRGLNSSRRAESIKYHALARGGNPRA
jgi:hypothetical protein